MSAGLRPSPIGLHASAELTPLPLLPGADAKSMAGCCFDDSEGDNKKVSASLKAYLLARIDEVSRRDVDWGAFVESRRKMTELPDLVLPAMPDSTSASADDRACTVASVSSDRAAVPLRFGVSPFFQCRSRSG